MHACSGYCSTHPGRSCPAAALGPTPGPIPKRHEENGPAQESINKSEQDGLVLLLDGSCNPIAGRITPSVSRALIVISVVNAVSIGRAVTEIGLVRVVRLSLDLFALHNVRKAAKQENSSMVSRRRGFVTRDAAPASGLGSKQRRQIPTQASTSSYTHPRLTRASAALSTTSWVCSPWACSISSR